MGWFWKKQGEGADESISARVMKIETRLTRVEAEILDIATAQDIIRNKVLRKIQFKKEDTEADKNDPYGGILLPVR